MGKLGQKTKTIKFDQMGKEDNILIALKWSHTKQQKEDKKKVGKGIRERKEERERERSKSHFLPIIGLLHFTWLGQCNHAELSQSGQVTMKER